MKQTLDSVVNQTILPSLWVIVDDGSTDDTSSILKDYSDKHVWIRVVTRQDRGHRSVGPGVIDAFYAGYNTVNVDEYEYLCKLDLDLRLPSQYFETLIKKMEQDPLIATCSGKAYIEEQGRLVSERHGDETSLGMTKFYRVDKFKAIGGFVREVMWDGIDCHRCRMHGWSAISWDEPELRFVHLRPMGSSQSGIVTGRIRHGYGQYFMGSGLLWMIATALYRIPERPYVLGGLFILWGWLKSAAIRKQRYEDTDFRKFLKRYQLLAIFFGKSAAIRRLMRSGPFVSK